MKFRETIILKALNNHVLWKEMRDICSLDSEYLSKTKTIKTLSIGGNIYIDKNSILDPLLRLEVENCKILDGYYPLSALASEIGLSDYSEKKIRKSEHSILFYSTYLFKIPNEFFNNSVLDKRMEIHSLTDEENDEDYDTVVQINSKFKIAGYTF